MPCWQTNKIVYEKLKINSKLLPAAVEMFNEWIGSKLSGRFKYLKLSLQGGGGGQTYLTASDPYTYTAYRLNLETGEAQYEERYQEVHHTFKRAYSMAAVQSVAKRSQVSRQFKMTKTSSRSVVLQRR